MNITELKSLLASDDCRGAACSAKGELRLFHRRGVADLFCLVSEDAGFLDGASVADRVIGRGAALPLVKGKAKEVYAEVISSGALSVLRTAGMNVTFGKEVAHIINRAGTGICPVEQLTAGTSSPDEAYMLIKQFIAEQQNA